MPEGGGEIGIRGRADGGHPVMEGSRDAGPARSGAEPPGADEQSEIGRIHDSVAVQVGLA